jgi:hypothetical protein
MSRTFLEWLKRYFSMNKIDYTAVKDESLIVDHYWDRMANEVAKLYWKYN